MRYASTFSKWLSVLLVLMCIILPVQAEDIPDGQDMSGDLPPVQEILPVKNILTLSVLVEIFSFSGNIRIMVSILTVLDLVSIEIIRVLGSHIRIGMIILKMQMTKLALI